MSRTPLANASANQINGVISFVSQHSHVAGPPLSPLRGINVVVQLCIAVTGDISGNGGDECQLLSHRLERIPVPLDHVRSFAGLRRCLRILLPGTLAQYGLRPEHMTQGAAIVPRPNVSDIIGITANDSIWQTYMNEIACVHHSPCQPPEICVTCVNPAYVIACFPAQSWSQIPFVAGITLSDRYHQEHGETLADLSVTEQARYSRMIQNGVIANGVVSAPPSTQNSTETHASQSSQISTPDPTRGPKGRSLVGRSSQSTPTKKAPDYSRGTLFPANGTRGEKEESDTCLTCIHYNRNCKGTTMKFVKASRKGRPSQ